MSDSLTTLIGKVQNLLGDASATVFTTAMCTAAIRQALSEWNHRAPNHAAVTITGVNDQYEYELTDVDAGACEIIDVLQEGDSSNEIDISVTYDQYIEDERVFFRLRSPVTTSDTLIVRYTTYHTISGLDSAVESTLLAKDDQAMVDGGAFYALQIRAAARAEANNLDGDLAATYSGLALLYKQSFDNRLEVAAKYRRAPVGEPDWRAWNDQYHYWGQ